MSTHYSIPRNHPLRFLPMVYILPPEMLVQYPTLAKLPRGLGGIQANEEHIAAIQSDQFLNEIMMATARLVFPNFGLGGWVEHYTGYCPAWKLAYAVHVWAKALDNEIGWGLQALFNLPKGTTIPFQYSDYIREAMRRAVERGLAEHNWQPILDVVREMPCHEDFEEWNTNVRKDFVRKWYHTRSKRVKMVSLEECLADENHPIYEIPVEDFTHAVISDDCIQQFKAQLSPKDTAILELRVGVHLRGNRRKTRLQDPQRSR